MKMLKSILFLLSIISICAVATAEVKISDITGEGTKAICKAGIFRTKPYKVKTIPEDLNGLLAISVPRGNYNKPGKEFSFKVDVPVTVYLFVDKRYKNPKLEGWILTKMTTKWTANRKTYQDVIYKKDFPAGIIKIPGNPKLIIPHMAVIKEK